MEQYREMGWLASEVLGEDERRRTEALRLGIPFVVLERPDIALEALMLIPEPLSRTHNIVAYALGEGVIEVALLDLEDLKHVEELRREQGASWKILPRLTNRESIKRALLIYQKHLKEKFAGMVEKGVEAADSLLRHALLSRATHIHLEPSTAVLLVRYRVQGALREAMRLPASLGSLITERYKALAKLFPVSTSAQEGRFKIEQKHETITASVSTLPLHGGAEKVTLRLARERRGQKGFTLTSLGLHGKGLERVHDMLNRRSGVLIVAGPKGSGKTALLYTLIDELNHPGLAIASIEEHIEYHLPHIAQLEMRPEVGLDMVAGLRILLKNDPDAVMVAESGEAAVQELVLSAAGRGIFVLAGLETSERELPTPAIITRLYSKLCEHCKAPHKLGREALDTLEEHANFGAVLAALKEEERVDKDVAWRDLTFFTAKGCNKCNDGYKGSVGVQEVLDVSNEMLNLTEDALFKAALGQLDIEAVVSSTQDL